MYKKNAWESYTKTDLKKLEAFAKDFRAFLDNGKTERECVTTAVAMAEKAGFSKILEARKAASKPAAAEEEVKAPPAEPCPAAILGVEVMDLEDAVKVLWKAGIYAESGMGCTGPVVLMSDANHDKAVELLRAAGYIG